MDAIEQQVHGLPWELLGRNAKLTQVYRSTVDTLNPAVCIGTAEAPGKICGKGPLLHVLVTAEGMFGMYSHLSWAPTGDSAVDNESFLWTTIGGVRKCKAVGTKKHLYFAENCVNFGGDNAVRVHLATPAYSQVNPDPTHFAGSDTPMHPTKNFTFSDYLVFSVSPENDASSRRPINVGGAWTPTFRDELRRLVETCPLDDVADDAVINLLIVGRYGVGKSSWINTSMSAMSGRNRQLLNAEPSNESVTKAMRKLVLRPAALSVTDVPGWDDDASFQSYLRLVRYALQGKVSEDEQLHPLSMELLDEIEERQRAAYKDRPHVIVVLRPTGCASREYDERIKAIIEEHKSKTPVMVLLSKADEFVPTSEDLSVAYQAEDVLRSREELAASLGIDPYRILPIASYGVVDYPSVPVEIMTLKALQLAQTLGERALVDHQRLQARLKAKTINSNRQKAAPSDTPVPPSGTSSAS